MLSLLRENRYKSSNGPTYRNSAKVDSSSDLAPAITLQERNTAETDTAFPQTEQRHIARDSEPPFSLKIQYDEPPPTHTQTRGPPTKVGFCVHIQS